MFVVMVNDKVGGVSSPFACCESRANALDAHAETVRALLASNCRGMSMVRLSDDYVTIFSRGTEIAFTVSIAQCLKY